MCSDHEAGDGRVTAPGDDQDGQDGLQNVVLGEAQEDHPQEGDEPPRDDPVGGLAVRCHADNTGCSVIRRIMARGDGLGCPPLSGPLPATQVKHHLHRLLCIRAPGDQAQGLFRLRQWKTV